MTPPMQASEKRYAEDGNLYTYAEFVEYFGEPEGARLWAHTGMTAAQGARPEAPDMPRDNTQASVPTRGATEGSLATSGFGQTEVTRGDTEQAPDEALPPGETSSFSSSEE